MHVERTEPINVTKQADQPYGIVVEHDRHELKFYVFLPFLRLKPFIFIIRR